MKLSKPVPGGTKTISIDWRLIDYRVMSEQWRNVRALNDTPRDICFWCDHKFKNGEMMAIAQPTREVSKLLCQSCASKIID